MIKRQIILLMLLATSVSALSSCGTIDRREQIVRLRKALCKVQKDMSKDEVLILMGKPDEARKSRDEISQVQGEPPCAEVWAYGTTYVKGFAASGVIHFDGAGRVLRTVAAIKNLPPGAILCAEELSDKPLVSPRGIWCVIENATAEVLSDQIWCTIQVTVVNGGTNDFAPSYHLFPVLGYNCVVEVYASTKTFVLQRSWLGSRSASLPQPAFLPAGKRVTDTVRVAIDGAGLGKPQGGTFYVRVFFPFENKRYFASNLLPFDYSVPVKQVLKGSESRRDKRQF